MGNFINTGNRKLLNRDRSAELHVCLHPLIKINKFRGYSQKTENRRLFKFCSNVFIITFIEN